MWVDQIKLSCIDRNIYREAFSGGCYYTMNKWGVNLIFKEGTSPYRHLMNLVGASVRWKVEMDNRELYFNGSIMGFGGTFISIKFDFENLLQ